MATVFTRIIQGEIPGRFVWRDEHCVAFLSADPLTPGHTLVVPVAEADHWLDLQPELAAHLMVVSQAIGQVQRTVFQPRRVGQMIQGFEVPHCHIHVWPTDSIEEFDFAQADRDPDAEQQDRIAAQLRQGLRQAGHGQAVPAED